jgi:hypothetical protein
LEVKVGKTRTKLDYEVMTCGICLEVEFNSMGVPPPKAEKPAGIVSLTACH